MLFKIIIILMGYKDRQNFIIDLKWYQHVFFQMILNKCM